MIYNRILEQILILLAIIVIGYFLKLTKLFKESDAETLNKLIINITMPVLIFLAVRNANLSITLFKIPFTGIFIISILIVLSYVIAKLKKIKGPLLGAFLIVCSMGNTGYLGYPLTISFFGEENLIKAIFYDVMATVVMIFTVGIFIAETFGQNKIKISRLKEILLFPPNIALVVGLLLIPFNIPRFIETNLYYIGQATIPLIMLAIGLTIHIKGSFKYKKIILYVLFLKLLFSPFLALLGVQIFNLPPLDSKITVLQASMPTMTFSLILGLKFGLDSKFISAAIFITTLFSIITITFWQMILA